MKETTKCHSLRLNDGTYNTYLKGRGIDICPQENDYLLPPNGDVTHYIRPKESAVQMNLYSDNQFNFVYASHVLCEMEYPEIALRNWIRICRPGGYIYVVVPDAEYYLQGQWPCRWNASHKWNFSLELPSNLPNNIIVNDWLRQFNSEIIVVKSFRNILNWDVSKPHGTGPISRPYRVDQTYPFDDNVVLNIEFILQKR